jgi:hypothetical protein
MEVPDMSLLELFCSVDDFWQTEGHAWLRKQVTDGQRRRLRATRLSPSEIMTIAIHFHQSHYRHFKASYTEYVQGSLAQEFPHLVSYQRFVELLPTILVPLTAYLKTQQGHCTGISFVDATALAVCKNPRIPRHRVFAGLAKRGKTSVGWFFGFKLHLVVNDQGEIVEWCLTAGNVHDSKQLPKLARRLFGKLFGDKGYLAQALVEQLLTSYGVHLVTRLRKNMANILMPLRDKLLLRKRAIIETINDQLKNQSQIEHSRHRSPVNFLVNLIAGLCAYCLQPKKPALHFDQRLMLAL